MGSLGEARHDAAIRERRAASRGEVLGMLHQGIARSALVRAGLLAGLLADGARGDVARAASVADSAGRPIPSAVLRWAGGEAVADEEGLVAIPEGVAPRCATAPGHVPVALSGPPEQNQKILLSRGAGARGRALSVDGRPVGGVRLRASGDDALGPCAREATSDAKGQWTLDGLRAGGRTELVVAEPAGWLSPSGTVMASPAAPSLDLRLHPAVDPQVLVLDASGAPLPGARVSLPADFRRVILEPPLSEERREAIGSFGKESDADGRVALPRLPSAIPWRVAATHPSRAPASATLTGGALASPRLRLTPGGSVRLRALDPAGMPLPGIGARPLAGPDADLVAEPRASGADGILIVRHLPPGRWDLRIQGPGVRPRLLRGIDVAEGAIAEAGDVLLEPGADIEGVVRAASGPVEGARVLAWTTAEGVSVKLETETGADGRFAFEGLNPEAKADVQASSDRHLPERRNDIEPGGDPLEFELELAASLVVVARDAVTGEAVAGATVEAGPGSGGARAFDARPGEGPGEILVTGLEEGTAGVIIRAPGYMSETRRDIAVRAGEVARIEVDLSEGATIEGIVVDRDTGQPVPFATIEVTAQLSRALADAEGRFALDGLRVPCDVIADSATHVSARMLAVDPALLPQSGLRIELDRGGSVEGVVLGRDGTPLPGARVSAAGSAGSALSGPDGRYRIDGLAEGPLRLTKTDGPGSWDGWEEAVVEIRRGSVARKDFGAGLRIVGRITHRGEPARGAQVSAMRADGEEGMPHDREKGLSTTDADGKYVLRCAEPGIFGVMVSWNGIEFGRQVTLPPDAREVVADLAVPEDHVAGRVVDDATGEPIAGATVTLRSLSRTGGGGSSSQMSSFGDDGAREVVRFESIPSSRAQTDAMGSFRVVVMEHGPASLWAWHEDYEGWASPEDFAVSGSRSDLEIRLKDRSRSSSRELRALLVDEISGEYLDGTILLQTRSEDGGGNVSDSAYSGQHVGMAAAPREGEVAEVTGWSSGRAIGHRGGIRPTGENIEIHLRLGPKGSLRVLVSPGSVTRHPMLAWQGDLRVRLPTGLVLEPANANLQANITARIAREEAAGEWLFDDLPPGPVSVSLGGSEWETVDVLAGAIAEIDLR